MIGNPLHPTAFHVSTRGEYGMRLMVDLARQWGRGAVSLHAAATREELPEAYLEQLVAALRKAGLVTGKRGAGGGYTLAREPSAISAGEVVRALEGPIEPQICTAEGDPVINCIREPGCGTRLVWLRLQSTIAHALDSMTLADLARATAAPASRAPQSTAAVVGDRKKALRATLAPAPAAAKTKTAARRSATAPAAR